jgi:hypothetical protein
MALIRVCLKEPPEDDPQAIIHPVVPWRQMLAIIVLAPVLLVGLYIVMEWWR